MNQFDSNFVWLIVDLYFFSSLAFRGPVALFVADIALLMRLSIKVVVLFFSLAMRCGRRDSQSSWTCVGQNGRRSSPSSRLCRCVECADGSMNKYLLNVYVNSCLFFCFLFTVFVKNYSYILQSKEIWLSCWSMLSNIKVSVIDISSIKLTSWTWKTWYVFRWKKAKKADNWTKECKEKKKKNLPRLDTKLVLLLESILWLKVVYDCMNFVTKLYWFALSFVAAALLACAFHVITCFSNEVVCVQECFPGNINMAYIIKPGGFWEKQRTSLGSAKYNFEVSCLYGVFSLTALPYARLAHPYTFYTTSLA